MTIELMSQPEPVDIWYVLLFIELRLKPISLSTVWVDTSPLSKYSVLMIMEQLLFCERIAKRVMIIMRLFVCFKLRLCDEMHNKVIGQATDRILMFSFINFSGTLGHKLTACC